MAQALHGERRFDDWLEMASGVDRQRLAPPGTRAASMRGNGSVSSPKATASTPRAEGPKVAADPSKTSIMAMGTGGWRVGRARQQAPDVPVTGGGGGEFCAVCQSECEDPIRTPCSHWFCLECILQSATVCGRRCPVCRRAIGGFARHLSKHSADTRQVARVAAK